MSAEASWLRLAVEIDARSEDAVSTLLIDATGGSAVEVLDRRAGQLVPAADDLPPGRLLVRAYCTEDQLLLLQGLLAGIDNAVVHDPEPIDDSWKTSWKDFFHATRVSDKFIIRPPWEALEEPPSVGTMEVVIEPGMAFGTGTHETTRLCIRAMEHLVRPEQRVLDVGCGSGVLSIVAAKLGARAVLGLDIDDPAMEASRENARVNGVGSRVTASREPLSLQTGTWDLVVANILSSILVSICDDLKARVRPGGTLLLSGILVTEADEVAAQFADHQFEEGPRLSETDWVCLQLQRVP